MAQTEHKCKMESENYRLMKDARNFNPHVHNLVKLQSITPSMRYDGKEDYAQWVLKAREKLKDLLGLPLISCEDKFQIEYVSENDTFKEVRFSFQSEEGYFVPCHFLVPTNAKLPCQTVICIQGHSKGMHISMGRIKFDGDEKTINGGDRDFAVRALKNGFCALVIEQRGMGECGGTPQGPACYIPTMTNLLIGRTTIGERVWDVSRAIDILEKYFPEADTKNLICLGNSGGGTTTFYASCIDERIKTVIPSCSVCSFDDSIAVMVHCSCNFIPGIRNYFDMGDLAGLIAPRDLIVVCGKDDKIFPLHGVKKTYEIIERMYKAAGAGRCKLVVGSGGHRFYADDAWAIFYDWNKQGY